MSNLLLMKSAQKGLVRNGLVAEYDFSIKGVNIMPKGSENFQTGWGAFSGATVTVTPGQVDPDGGTGAFRIQTSGGTNVLKYLTTAILSNLGTPYSHQLWIKVNTEKDVKISPNTKINPPTRTVTQTEGWVQVKIPGTVGSGSYNVQMQCQAIVAEDALDFTVYQPKIEIGSNCTAYSAPIGVPQTLWNKVNSSVQVTNLVQNGNFAIDSDGNGIADNWANSSTNSQGFKVENNIQYWTPLNNSWSGSLQQSPTHISATAGHKYYLTGIFKNVGNVYFLGTNSDNIGYFSSDGKQSRVVTATYTQNDAHLTLYGYTANVESSISNLILIDLTELFGAGNEPTKEQCDLMFLDWFDGTVNMSLPLYNGVLGSTEGADTNDPTWMKECLQFGVDDFVTLIPFLTGSLFTIELVASPTQAGESLFRANNGNSSYIRIDPDQVLIRSTTDDTSVITAYISPLQYGTWSYLAVCVDYLNAKVYVYKDGVLDAIGDLSTLSQNFMNVLTAMKFNDPSYPFAGSLAYGIIRQGVILNPSQIKQNYNYLKSKLLVERGIVLP